MTERRIPRTTLVAVMVALIAGLIARTIIQTQLIKAGYRSDFSADLSYLVVPVIMMILLFPIWHRERQFIIDQFQRIDISWKIAAQAVVLGILMRLAWWSQLIAGVSFGLYESGDPDAIVGPVFSFQCASPHVVVLGFLVMAVLVPLIEEIVSRAYVVTAVRRNGIYISILVSAIIFAIFHRYSSLPYAFVAGVIFGVQYWHTKSLWSSLITHATFNAIIQVDWRCSSIHWNPPTSDLPVWMSGSIACIVLFASVIGIMWLMRVAAIEAQARAPIARAEV